RMTPTLPRTRPGAGPSGSGYLPNTISFMKAPASEGPGPGPDAEVPKKFTAKTNIAATASRAASAARRFSIVSPHRLWLTCQVGGQVSFFKKGDNVRQKSGAQRLQRQNDVIYASFALKLSYIYTRFTRYLFLCDCCQTLRALS